MSACPISMTDTVAGLDLYGVRDFEARRWYARVIRLLDQAMLESVARDREVEKAHGKNRARN